jgi:hypothetical protein
MSFFSLGTKRILGLDIGSFALKLVELKAKKKGKENQTLLLELAQ